MPNNKNLPSTDRQKNASRLAPIKPIPVPKPQPSQSSKKSKGGEK